MKWIAVSLCVFLSTSLAQVSSFPYIERFDSVGAPALPSGWTTTTNRSTTGDFVTTTSTPRSSPNSVLSTNATISQSLVSPTLDFSGRTPTRLEFYTARSSTHTAGLLVEASLDNGVTFPVALSDTIRHPGTTGYMLTSLALPSLLANRQVRIRWRLVGAAGGGTTGTFRMDDISLSATSAFDLAVTRLMVILTDQEGVPSSTLPITIRATVKNVGSSPAGGYTLQFAKDANLNGVAEASERFMTLAGEPLAPGDSLSLNATHAPPGAGDHRFLAVISYAQDGNPANDTASTLLSIGAEKKALVVNEILYDPLPGQNEWIELCHRGSTPIDLARWKLSDRPTASGANSFILTTSSRILQPGDFVVMAADSSILLLFPYLATPSHNAHLLILNRSGGFSLNNDGDDVILRDGTGRTIDSVSYSPTWHHPDVTDTKGRSLERVNPNIDSNDRRNWSTSPVAPGGTPGRANSIYTTSLPSNASVAMTPNPFSPDGDGFEDFCNIRYNLPQSTAIIRVTIFDIKGRLIRTLANGELTGPQGELIWDGFDDGRQRARIGPYIVFLEAIDSQGGTIATARAVAVVATKL